jgi:hypothetical protein
MVAQSPQLAPVSSGHSTGTVSSVFLMVKVLLVQSS